MHRTTKPSQFLLTDLRALADAIRWGRDNGLSDEGILDGVLHLLDEWVPPPSQPRSEPEPPLLPGMLPERERSDP